MKSMDEFVDIYDVKKNSDDYKTCKDRAKQKYYEGRLQYKNSEKNQHRNLIFSPESRLP